MSKLQQPARFPFIASSDGIRGHFLIVDDDRDEKHLLCIFTSTSHSKTPHRTSLTTIIIALAPLHLEPTSHIHPTRNLQRILPRHTNIFKHPDNFWT
ncbi:hypothetical protein TWF679_006491 [Orbilia oligospora]|uniref:Uncharacterized protein n=1 Tax=Orbilia oligospora TaxID=2813651 RepID=A0A8H8V9V5_ORBOL|nr:hypothetical protein TWF679_006491 [Orbilia oligospora]